MEKEEKETDIRSVQRDRSTAYPSIALDVAIDSMKRLKDALGKGPYSREEAARGLGYKGISGVSARVVAALVHYGLLDRTGSVYRQSDLAQQILYPIDERQKAAAVTKAARMPKLFDLLVARYGGQALPSLLENILMREGVSNGAAGDVVKTFRETLQFASLLQNGVVMSIEPLAVTSDANSKAVLAGAQKPPVASVSDEGSHVFRYVGGVCMLIPRGNQNAEDALLDGELKDVKGGLKKFAEKYFGGSENKED